MQKHDLELPAAYELIVFEQLEALRSKAKELANQGADEGLMIWALDQNNAYARLDKRWVCNQGDLHCSLILRPDFQAENFYQMLIVAVISLGNSIASFVSPMTALGYQWPNDITIANHKIASLWIDQGTVSGNPWLSITTSVNIIGSPETEEFKSLSIHEAEGTSDLTHEVLLEAYSREFIKQINNWSQRGFEYIYAQWMQRLESVNQANDLHISKDSKLRATIKAVNDHGDIQYSLSNNDSQKLSIEKYMGLCS